MPFPAECMDESHPHNAAAWEQYWRDREHAARIETADEAVMRCRDEATFSQGGVERFDLVLETVVEAFDSYTAHVNGPDGESWRGLSLDESGPFGGWQLRLLAAAWAVMVDAFERLDREAFRKAAAGFAETMADMTSGMTVISRSAKNSGGDQ